jgi:hypothetical protein
MIITDYALLRLEVSGELIKIRMEFSFFVLPTNGELIPQGLTSAINGVNWSTAAIRGFNAFIKNE